MITLVIDTSSKTACVGLFRGETLIAEQFVNNGLTHSETLGVMLDNVLSYLPEGESISLVGVTNGPGSFTGLRIGVAAALGVSTAFGCECAGVSSLEAAAWGLRDCGGYIRAVMDARRNEFYTALFLSENGTVRRITEDTALPKEQISDADSEDTFYAGDAAAMFNSRPVYPKASGIFQCIATGHTRKANDLNYLRKPQAEREYDEQKKGQKQ